MYRDRREAALSAFHAGYRAATAEQKHDRALRLMLLALKRDPALVSALFDLAVLCARDTRWQDAIDFQEEILRREPGSETARLASAELERLKVLSSLHSVEGEKRKAYDTQLLAALANKDSVKAMVEATSLTKVDSTRWEAFALLGLLHAEQHEYSESGQALEVAARLAPAARRPRMLAAVEIARTEANATRQATEGDAAWAKQDYQAAAKSYDEAWETSPGRLDIGLRSGVAFLMADQVPMAVTILSRLRGSAAPDQAARITAVLKELGAISEDAKAESGRDPAHEGPVPLEPGARIRKEISPIATTEMEISTRPAPALLQDKTIVIPATDPNIESPENNQPFYSTVSLFKIYRDSIAAPAAPPEQIPAPQVGRQESPALDRIRAASAASESASVGKGPVQPVDVRSEPAGASITFDADQDSTPTQCLAPCRVSLPAGRHTLLAKLAGYRDSRRIIQVARDLGPVSVLLDPKGGTVLISSNPSALIVSVDGKSTTRRTPVGLPLPEGTHDISVEIDGQTVVRRVSVADGDSIKLQFGAN